MSTNSSYKINDTIDKITNEIEEIKNKIILVGD